MRRNNGWLAILAISMVLPNLRHGLADEQLPLDYGNTELRANRSKSAYESRASNRTIHNLRNHDNHEESFLPTDINQALSTSTIPNERLKSVSQPASSGERTNSKEGKLRLEDSQKRTDKSLANERIAETEILDRIRNSPSSWISAAKIKDHSRTKEPSKREKQTLTSETPTGNQLAIAGHPYYGHVDGNLQNDEFLRASEKGGQEKDPAKGFSTKELNAEQKNVNGTNPTPWDNALVYNLMISERVINKSIRILNRKGNENTEKPYPSFDLKSLNQSKQGDHSSNFTDELTFNKSAAAENPLGNETLLKQASLVNKNASRDNGSTFSTNPDFPIAFTESNTREYLSVKETTHNSSNQNHKESNDKQIQQEIKNIFNNETNVNNMQEDFTFDEENITDNSIKEKGPTPKALDLNDGEPGTGSLMLDNEHQSNRQDRKETDAIELNATRKELNEHDKEDEFKATQEEGSLFKSVTKDAEVSLVEPLTENPTHSSMIESKKNFNKKHNETFPKRFQIIAQTMKTERTKLKSLKQEKNISLNDSKPDQETRFVNQSLMRIRVISEERSNGSIIVSDEEFLVPQNSVEKIKNNEPTVGFRWKNAENKGVVDGSGDNGTLNQVNPTRNEGKDIEHPTNERSMDRRVSGGIMARWINQRFPKGRKSRSSKVTSTTSTSLELGSSDLKKHLEERAFVSSNEDARNQSNLSNGPTLSESLDHSLEFVLRNQSKNLTEIVQDPEEIFIDENVTFSTTEFGLLSNEQPSFGFDVNPLEMNGEERANVEDELYKVNNSSVEMEPLNQWPVKHSAVVEGDLVLGGLMMVHEREDTVTCGPVMPQGGVQALEAMLYTLDRLNDREIVPGVKIGAHILDDCDKDTYGLEMAVDFIKGSISNIDGAEYHCNKTAVRKVISGVVGAASSVTSIQVANLLRLFRIPQVSFFSTSPELSNKQRFEYFTRTIPSDHYQVKAMVDIVLIMGWSYVSIIYEESNYGIKAFEELEELLGKHDICIAIKEKLVKDSGVAEETAYDNIVLKLLTKPRARGCIIFGSDQEVAGVMRAVRRCNATGAFSWIGSDGWSARGLVSNGNEAEVEGTLSVQPQANPVKGFEEYFLNLTVENNRRNPWFVEFWEDHFQCRYPNASRTPYNQKYTKPCTTKERLTKQNTAFEDQLQFVSDAVMAFAYAFRDMHRDLCHGKPGLCDSMKPTKGTELLKYLRKVDFEGLSGDKFKFDKNGDGPARYNIIHFKQVQPGKYKWIRVGKYLEGELRLNMSEIQFKLGHPQPPESVCSLPCEVGQAKKYVEGERCCWHCFNCTQYQIRHPKDETQCIPCRQGTVPDETHSTCRDIPEEFLRPESGWAIGAMSFSAVGIMITMFVGGVFLKHNDTPVVRASGRELSYVLLSGILFCYLVTFALVLRPTDIVCCIQRFAAGFCFTVVYAALLTKTNRISRIFNASKHSAKRPSFISPRSQLIICSGLVFVQILINGVWMIIDPARAMHHYPTREDNLLVCNSYVDASYMIAFAYPIMLIVVCTVYAVLTRKIPEAFNESKHIGFTMYTTCVIWLAFVPLYFGTGNNVALRITSMSVTISLSASVTIACLFSPKLYIILIRPERNVRQSMMPARYSTTKSSAVTATNASSMIAPITLTAATCDQNKAVKKHIITTIDCSTQSEYYELEVKDQKNGKPPPTVVSRSTQTSGNNEESSAIVSSKDSNENTATTKQLNNNARIGNGPVSQSDVPL